MCAVTVTHTQCTVLQCTFQLLWLPSTFTCLQVRNNYSVLYAIPPHSGQLITGPPRKKVDAKELAKDIFTAAKK